MFSGSSFKGQINNCNFCTWQRVENRLQIRPQSFAHINQSLYLKKRTLHIRGQKVEDRQRTYVGNCKKVREKSCTSMLFELKQCLTLPSPLLHQYVCFLSKTTRAAFFACNRKNWYPHLQSLLLPIHPILRCPINLSKTAPMTLCSSKL